MDYWGKYTQRRLPFSKSLWMPNPFSWGTLGPHPPCPIFSRDSAAAVAWGFVFKHNYYGDTVLPDAGGQKDLRSPDLVGAALKVAAVPLSPGPTWPGAFHPPPPPPAASISTALPGAPGQVQLVHPFFLSQPNTQLSLLIHENHLKNLQVECKCFVLAGPTSNPGQWPT